MNNLTNILMIIVIITQIVVLVAGMFFNYVVNSNTIYINVLLNTVLLLNILSNQQKEK